MSQNKSDAEIVAEFAMLSPEEQQRVRGYQATPIGSAMALNKEQQKINENLTELKESLRDMQRAIMLLLGNHEARLDEHDRYIKDLGRRMRILEGRAGIAG